MCAANSLQETKLTFFHQRKVTIMFTKIYEQSKTKCSLVTFETQVINNLKSNDFIKKILRDQKMISPTTMNVLGLQ